ncbi:MAG: helix-turn-helix transcriptional regulator [Chloroflexota bacterium]|nr:helix-turn-helix transcriptional regulator [Chloroflexota bacterium]
MTNIHIGSSFDDFLREDDTSEAASTSAAIRVLGWQLRQQIEEQGISKAEMARRMGTSRSQVDRLLNADSAEIKLSTLERAAKAVNRSLILQLS